MHACIEVANYNVWQGQEDFIITTGIDIYLLLLQLLLQFKLGISSHLPLVVLLQLLTQNAFPGFRSGNTPYISYFLLDLIIQYFIAAAAASITVASLLFCAMEKCMQGFIFIASEFSHHYIKVSFIIKSKEGFKHFLLSSEPVQLILS